MLPTDAQRVWADRVKDVVRHKRKRWRMRSFLIWGTNIGHIIAKGTDDCGKFIDKGHGCVGCTVLFRGIVNCDAVVCQNIVAGALF